MKTKSFKCEKYTMTFDTEIRLQKHFMKTHPPKKNIMNKNGIGKINEN
ncbi:hypothetical protein [Nitrosopumilus ureiphilus]|nr:hypothetical protein [Nitrosopumilus ureiphilus]